MSGELVSWQQIKFSDVIGEGSILLLSGFWAFAVLVSRPPGRVTTFLVLGLTLFTASSLIDFLDEFTDPYSSSTWLSFVESIPAAIGMLVMSVALYWWHQEQLSLNRQLYRRELDYRWHKEIDPITLLYRGNYFIDRAKQQIPLHQNTSLVVFDLVSFSSINRQFGLAEGDRILREVAQLLVMNLRSSDLACRYAGDRFVVLLPNTDFDNAQSIALQIQKSIQSVAFKPHKANAPLFTHMRFVFDTLNQGQPLEQSLQALNQAIDNMSEVAA